MSVCNNERFVVRKPAGDLFDWQTMAEFTEQKLVRARSEANHPEFGEMDFYCQNQECAVRGVTIHVKYRNLESVQEKMNCPLCGKSLSFHGYSVEVALTPEIA